MTSKSIFEHAKDRTVGHAFYCQCAECRFVRSVHYFDIRFPAFSGETVYCKVAHFTAQEAIQSVVTDPDLKRDFLKHTGREIAASDVTATLNTEKDTK